MAGDGMELGEAAREVGQLSSVLVEGLPISLVDLGKPDNEAQIHFSPDLVAPQPPFWKIF